MIIKLSFCPRCRAPHVPPDIADRVKNGEHIQVDIIYQTGVAGNVLRWGTGALNINGCRVSSPGETITNHARSGDAEVLFGASKAQDTYQSDGQALGRWPANVVHDGSDEVVGAFPNTTSNPGTLRSTAKQGANVAIAAERQKGTVLSKGDSGSAARFFYSAKASKADRNGSKHPTVKPIALMQWLARLITPPGGTVLDPFAGSGTTGEAARREGFNVILCEREDEYVADIRRRLSGDPLARLLRWNAAVASYRAKVAA